VYVDPKKKVGPDPVMERIFKVEDRKYIQGMFWQLLQNSTS
jgi:hypothetical protein